MVSPTHAEWDRITGVIRQELAAQGKLGEEREFTAWAPLHLTEAQKKASVEFAEGRGYAVRGPFAVMLRSPEVMLRAKAMGDYLRFKSTIPPRLNEFAILITARQWGQNYEWQAHRPLAEKAGLKPDIAQAVADGRRPSGMAADDRTRQLAGSLIAEACNNAMAAAQLKMKVVLEKESRELGLPDLPADLAGFLS